MKVKIGFIIVFISITIFSFAQKKNFNASIFLGFNGIHIEGDNEVLYNSTNGTIWGTGGITGGISVKRNFTNSLYWTFDLRYIRKGSIYEFTNIQGVQDFESIKLYYAELPVLIGYTSNTRKYNIYLELGASVAKLMNSEKLISDFSYGQDISLFDQFRDYDYSILGAAKLSLRKHPRFLYGIRVSRSVRSIHNVYQLYNFDYGLEFSY